MTTILEGIGIYIPRRELLRVWGKMPFKEAIPIYVTLSSVKNSILLSFDLQLLHYKWVWTSYMLKSYLYFLFCGFFLSFFLPLFLLLDLFSSSLVDQRLKLLPLSVINVANFLFLVYPLLASVITLFCHAKIFTF